jgi:hypothetical protein
MKVRALQGLPDGWAVEPPVRQVVAKGSVMRRLFDLMTGQNVFHQFGNLIRHIGDEPVEPVDLASLIVLSAWARSISSFSIRASMSSAMGVSCVFLGQPVFRCVPDVCRGRYIAGTAKHQLS